MMLSRMRFFPLLLFSLLALLLGMWAGLLRLGWAFPSFSGLALAHGPLMVSGFLGVLIPLERAVALRHRWMYGVPLASGLGWVLLFVRPALGIALFSLASLGMLGILSVMMRREAGAHTFTMGLGGLAWLIGNLLWWSGTPLYRVVLWWMLFLVLTIAGERLELNRVLRPTAGRIRSFVLLVLLALAASGLSLFNQALGTRLLGLAFFALALWFLRFDLAVRNLRHPLPLTRYLAFALAGGFLWLGVSGLLLLGYGAVYAGPAYEVALHALFVGFVFAMIFGHALIIFPAIFGQAIPFSPVFYVPLGLLHLSMLLRLSGWVTFVSVWRQWGGLLNALAILVFFFLIGMTFIRSRRG